MTVADLTDAELFARMDAALEAWRVNLTTPPTCPQDADARAREDEE